MLFNWMHGSEESNIMMTQRITLEDDGNTEGANIRQVLCQTLSSVLFLCYSIFEMLSTCVQVLAKSFTCVCWYFIVFSVVCISFILCPFL